MLLAFLIGLLPFSMRVRLQRAYYALGDTRTPFLFQLVQSALFVAGALAVAVVAPDPLVAAGIALVTSIAGTAQAIVAAVLLRRRLGGVGGRRVVAPIRGLPARDRSRRGGRGRHPVAARRAARRRRRIRRVGTRPGRRRPSS